MWFPRIKIRIINSVVNKYYEYDKWVYICDFKTKKMFFRYRRSDYLEFIIDGYESKQEALKDGKILFSNILFYGYKSFFNFNMGDATYITKAFHDNQGYTIEDFSKNEEWFFNTKKYSADFLGLSIYEANDKNDLDTYKSLYGELRSVMDDSIDLIEWVKNIDYDLTYTENNYKIFHMFKLVEYSDTNTQILLLCQILEIMGINSDKSDKIKHIIDNLKIIIDSEDISNSEKESLKGGLENLKHESSRKKIKELLKKYSKKEYKSFNKYNLVNECYKLRSLIIHGDVIDETGDAFDKAFKLKTVVLDIFKEWVKDNK